MINRLCKLTLAAVLIFFCAKLLIYHLTLINYPFPLQYREGAMMTSTQALTGGLNPFDLKLQPQYTNDYGILYPALVAPLAKIFGVTMKVHRWVTAFFIFAVLGVLALVMRRLKAPFLLNVSGLLILYACLLYPATTTPSADPSSLGMFLFLMVILWPWLCHYSWKSMGVAALLAIAAYYTKPYFIVAVALSASHIFFFVSKKKGFLFSVLFFVLFGLSIYLMHSYANCYFANCFFIHDNIRHLYDEHLKWQVIAYTKLHAPLLGLLVVALGFAKKEPLRRYMPPHLYAGAGTLLLLVMWLGKHNGANLWYFFHLLSPFLIITVISLAARLKHWQWIAAPAVVMNLWMVASPADFRVFDAKNEQWNVIKTLITNNQKVLTTALFTPLLIEQGKEFDDSGLSEYFRMGGYRYNKHLAKIFPEDSKVILQYYKYNDKVADRIVAKYFNIVIITRNYAPLVPSELTQYYENVGDIEVFLPHQGSRYVIAVLKPKP